MDDDIGGSHTRIFVFAPATLSSSPSISTGPHGRVPIATKHAKNRRVFLCLYLLFVDSEPVAHVSVCTIVGA